METLILGKLQQKFSNLSEFSIIPQSGQSFTYSARDDALKRKVFLKVIPLPSNCEEMVYAEPQKLVDLFQQEEDSRRYNAILYSVEKIQVDKDVFVVLQTEFCEGRDLAHFIPKYGLSIEDSLKIAMDICRGTHFLHKIGIVHRDLKPGNVMVSPGKTKLVDFGSALYIGTDEWKTVNSSKTLLYSPPETLLEKKRYSKKSDLYQIGAILWEMVFGVFEYNRIDDKIKRKVSKSITGFDPTDSFWNSKLDDYVVCSLAEKASLYPLLSLPKSYIPAKLMKLMKKAVSFDPSKRYSSCTEFCAEITSLHVPNWKQESEDLFVVTNWKGKDYRMGYEKKRKEVKFFFEESATGKNVFRRNNSITDFEKAVKKINVG